VKEMTTKIGITTVGKWAPYPEFGHVSIAPAMLPAADVYETATEFVFELEVPRYDENELAVDVSDHTLTIKGERMETKEEEEEKKEKAKGFRLQERLEWEFERRFQLPPEADTMHMKAVFGEGVLEVRAPKLKTATPHSTVEITKT
jgi:HSP20 family protein